MNLKLRTERLLLTPLEAGDVDLALEMYTDPEVLKHGCGEMTEAEIRREMSDMTRRGGNGGIGTWCIRDRRSDEKLGAIYLLPLPIDEKLTDYSLVVMGQMPRADIEIGFFFKRSAWGRGFATEACRRVLRFAFHEDLLSEVLASVHEDNVASMKVLEKSGMIARGRMRCYGEDFPVYRMTRAEWHGSERSSDVPMSKSA